MTIPQKVTVIVALAAFAGAADMQFVLVFEDGAMRTRLWNPRGFWEHDDSCRRVEPYETCGNPTHWMPLPDGPIASAKITHPEPSENQTW